MALFGLIVVGRTQKNQFRTLIINVFIEYVEWLESYGRTNNTPPTQDEWHTKIANIFFE